jgi:hypothetical protein
MNGKTHPALDRALAVSRELLAAAVVADMPTIERLDADRFRLLQSLRPLRDRFGAGDWIVMKEISELNDQALGLMEHHRRALERSLDMAAVGRRAVVAYSETRP